jgi:hypothetical protein
MKSKKQKFTVTFEQKCYTYVTPKECSNDAALMPFLRQCCCNISILGYAKDILKFFQNPIFPDVTATFAESVGIIEKVVQHYCNITATNVAVKPIF